MAQPQLVERREDVPHAAVIRISVEVHERLPSGDLRGLPVHKVERIVKVEGSDRFICIRRLNELLKLMAEYDGKPDSYQG